MGGNEQISQGVGTVTLAHQGPNSGSPLETRESSISSQPNSTDAAPARGVIRADDDRPDAEESEGRTTDHDPVATAWNIHATILDWTRGVDSKASFVSAIEVAVLLGILTLAGDQRLLSRLDGVWQQSIFWLGVFALIASVMLVLWVVSPHLRSARIRAEYQSNVIFFGHAKFWDPRDMARLLRDDDILPMLTRQITAASNIAWKKHRNLQLSIFGFVIGASLVGAAVWMSTLGS